MLRTKENSFSDVDDRILSARTKPTSPTSLIENNNYLSNSNMSTLSNDRKSFSSILKKKLIVVRNFSSNDEKIKKTVYKLQKNQTSETERFDNFGNPIDAAKKSYKISFNEDVFVNEIQAKMIIDPMYKKKYEKDEKLPVINCACNAKCNIF